ncbi:MAG: hypothetical protein XU11_C0003G0025 [Candidatus Dadabacteria bacterium CSP1-2]|jgi:hypothetical protein|nr:MAG: hypothetical protein XU11_C0003G0025 [Candidatus Dadabacteria bacterium CSP1-2]
MPLIQSNPEVLTRYLYNSNYIRKSNQTVKWAAFMPNPKDNQTSVFRVLGLSESEIWNIADCDVTPYQQNTIKGRADINSNDVINISVNRDKLFFYPKEPPYRHGTITGWSNQKSINKLLALKLEDKANLRVNP